MSKISVTCPQCNANFQEDDNKKSTFCMYCGAQIFLVDSTQRSETINRTIDEARIKEAELALERLKVQDKQSTQDRKTVKIVIAGVAAVIGICITIAVLYFLNIGELRDTVDYENYDRKEICAGSNKEYEGRNYEDVMDELKALGFKNVQAKSLHDSILIIRPEGTVGSVSIDGKTEFSSEDTFDKHATVLIRYH